MEVSEIYIAVCLFVGYSFHLFLNICYTECNRLTYTNINTMINAGTEID